MPKNRDYTGLERTPAYMSWLLRQRSILKGELDRIDKAMEELPRKRVVVSEQLAALDMTIGLHEVKVEPAVVKGRRKQRPRLFPPGSVVRGVLEALRKANGQPLFTVEIALQLLRATGTDVADVHLAQVVDTVWYRLRDLAKEGLVRRHPGATENDHVAWSLIAQKSLKTA